MYMEVVASPPERMAGTSCSWIAAACLPLAFMIALTAFQMPASACPSSNVTMFKPTLARFEWHPGPAQQDPSQGGNQWEPVPEPEVYVVDTARETASAGMPCADVNAITFSVGLPRSSTYRIEQFGVYFRMIKGSLPDAIFPGAPVAGSVKKNEMTIVFTWQDSRRSVPAPLEGTVEVFLVTNGLDIGPSAVVHLGRSCGDLMGRGDMNVCADQSLKGVDAKRNQAYETLMARIERDPYGNLLQNAESAWIAYRDKHCEFVASATEGGSVQPFIWSSCLIGLTRERVDELTYQLDCEEGDLSCVGWIGRARTDDNAGEASPSR